MFTLRSIFEVEDRLSAKVYQKLPIAIVKGRGAKVWDAEGREYLDFMSSYGVALVGHSHPKVAEAVKKQVEKLISCHGSLYNDARAEFLKKLIGLMPKGLDKAFLSNSGAEAVECALKLARKFTGRRKVVAMNRAYHGKTMGALSATWEPKYRLPFEPLLSGFTFTPFGKVQKIEKAVTEETAAVILEPIQGESGIIIPPEGFLREVREVCDRRGALLILDEVQTGLGRTGRMWAFEHWDIVPDIVCIAKAVAGGIPMGVTVAKGGVMDSLKIGEHTTTFGGNPLACAAASAVIDVIVKEKLPERAREIGGYFKRKLEEECGKIKLVREIRGLGLMLAIELRFNVIPEVVPSMASRGLITLYSGLNVIRLLPPLVVSREEVDAASKILSSTLAEESLKKAP